MYMMLQVVEVFKTPCINLLSPFCSYLIQDECAHIREPVPITILEVEGRQLEQAIITCELTSLGNGFRRRTPTLLPITVHHNVAQPRIAMIDSECRDIQNRSLAVSPKHEVFEEMMDLCDLEIALFIGQCYESL